MFISATRSPNFGITDHLLAAEVGKLDAERPRQVFLKDRFGAPQIASVDVARMKRADVEAAIELGRVRAQVHPVEAARVDVAAAVDLDLPFFGGRRRRERHLAAPENDDAGDAGVGLGDEADAVGHAQLEVFRAQREVHDSVLLFGVQRQPIQAAHRRQDVESRNAPLRRRRTIRGRP